MDKLSQFKQKYNVEARYYNFDFEDSKKDPEAVLPERRYNREFIIALYKHILGVEVDDNYDGLKHWMGQLSKGMSRENIELFFRNTARQDLTRKEKEDFFESLPKNEKRVLLVMPGSIGDLFLCTALFKSIRENYPDYKFFVATNPKYSTILLGNEYVDQIIPYDKRMDNLLWLEGRGNHRGYFDVAYLPYVNTQRVFTYQHNGTDKIGFNINK